MLNMNKLKKLTELFKELPGVSLKTAERMAISTIENKKDNIKTLKEIILLSEELEKDELTGLIINKNTKPNENKEKDILLILESNNDVLNILEKTKSNKSLFILDMKNKRNFEETKKIIDRLIKIIRSYNTKEILFLLTPSIESELIMRVVKEEIDGSNIPVKPNLTRLSMGIPFGGSIEFTDERTIREAIKKREKA